MRVVDPGHIYMLRELDRNTEVPLVFVKREGPGYPGNKGHHPGVTLQEVLRALVHRAEYVNNQIFCEETTSAIEHLKEAIWELEARAASRHGRQFNYTADEVVVAGTCIKCGHVGCQGACH